jgi:hypothetical protein
VRRSKGETEESSRELLAALRREAALTSSLDAANALLSDLQTTAAARWGGAICNPC